MDLVPQGGRYRKMNSGVWLEKYEGQKYLTLVGEIALPIYLQGRSIEDDLLSMHLSLYWKKWQSEDGITYMEIVDDGHLFLALAPNHTNPQDAIEKLCQEEHVAAQCRVGIDGATELFLTAGQIGQGIDLMIKTLDYAYRKFELGKLEFDYKQNELDNLFIQNLNG